LIGVRNFLVKIHLNLILYISILKMKGIMMGMDLGMILNFQINSKSQD